MAVPGRRSLGARRAVLAGLLLFVVIQLAFFAGQEYLFPYSCDHDYLYNLALLQQRRREAPQRPLCLLMGSSRTALSFCPEWLPAVDTDRALVFNFSHFGAGPIMNLMLLRRLLDAGVHPRWLVLEVLPGYLVKERDDFLVRHIDARDLPRMARYVDRWKLARWYVWWQLQTVPRFPLLLLQGAGPSTSSALTNPALVKGGPFGGWLRWLPHLTEEERRRRTADAREAYESLLQDFRINPAADAALRRSLALCQENEIGVVLMLTPEGSEFRRWYGADTEATLADYLTRLSGETGVPVVDARRWLPDDAFYDSHHVLERGAREFTRRLEAEVLRPLLHRNGRGATSP
jgi:hypothetical protein